MSYLDDLDPEDLRNKYNELERRVLSLEQRTIEVGSLDELSTDLGEQQSGQVLDLVARGELQTVLLSADNQMVVGGSILVCKSSGKIVGQVADDDEEIDFGQEMTEGDWVKLAGPDTSGEYALEWMLVGALIEETTYEVTRDVDGSGANDWPASAPFAVIGQEGDCRIEQVAGEEAQIALVRQGATWDAYTIETSMSTSAGAITAAGGKIMLDSNGQLMSGIGFPVIFTADDGSERVAELGMFIPDGETAPAFRLSFREPDGTNLISNPGFETGTLDDWTPGSDWALATDSVHSGSKSAKLSTTNNNLSTWPSDQQASISLISDKVSVDGGHVYQVNAWVKTARVGSNLSARFWIDWYDGSSVLVGRTSVWNVSSTGDNDWTNLSSTVKAPAGAEQAELRFFARSLVGGAGNDVYLWVDDVSLSAIGVFHFISITDSGVILSEAYIGDAESRISSPTDRRYLAPVVTDFLRDFSDPFTTPGTFSSGALNRGTPDADHQGILTIRSTATANSGGIATLAHSALMLLSGGEVFEAIFSLPDAASQTVVRLGFLDTANQNDPADGVYIKISNVTLTGRAANNSSESTTSSDYTVSTSTWYRCKVEYVSASEVIFSLFDMDGSLLWTDTLTTNIPYDRATGCAVIAHRTNSVATFLLDLDWVALYKTTPMVR